METLPQDRESDAAQLGLLQLYETYKMDLVPFSQSGTFKAEGFSNEVQTDLRLKPETLLILSRVLTKDILSKNPLMDRRNCRLAKAFDDFFETKI